MTVIEGFDCIVMGQVYFIAGGRPTMLHTAVNASANTGTTDMEALSQGDYYNNVITIMKSLIPETKNVMTSVLYASLDSSIT